MIVTVVGNRPQFIKMAPVSHELRRRGIKEYIIHTGQHYDENMSQVFFDELEIPTPDLNLSVHSSKHGAMTADMLARLEEKFLELAPKALLIYGDTNSTLAAALAAVKIHIPIAHVEAGPRIYDIDTPEEINRIVADHSARLRFAPDEVSVENLKRENIVQGVSNVGDLMYQAFCHFKERALERSTIFQGLGLNECNPFALMTIHRPNNTDDKAGLKACIEMLKQSPLPFVFAVHPRTKAAFERAGLWEALCAIPSVTLAPPLGYLDMLALLQRASIVVTDSGGLQKEAYFAGRPCLVMFHATPWPQILELGWQRLQGGFSDLELPAFLEALSSYRPTTPRREFFGDGRSAEYVVDQLIKSDLV